MKNEKEVIGEVDACLKSSLQKIIDLLTGKEMENLRDQLLTGLKLINQKDKPALEARINKFREDALVLIDDNIPDYFTDVSGVLFDNLDSISQLGKEPFIELFTSALFNTMKAHELSVETLDAILLNSPKKGQE